MKEINLGKIISKKRKEKEIKQEDLALYLGVSKAAVSKWETGQSYPDISLLPVIASYFDISVDELIDYSPQMTVEDIKKTTKRIYNDFSTKTFDDVYEECQRIIKKYYSCYPLLLQMAGVLSSHYYLAENSEKYDKINVVDDAIGLLERVKSKSNEGRLMGSANILHATCLMIKNDPQGTIDLLDNNEYTSFYGRHSLLASAYCSLEKTKKAKEVLQLGIYENVMSIFGLTPMLISLNQNDPKKAEEVIERMFGFAEVFKIRKLFPSSLLMLCLNSAEYYSENKDADKTMQYLNEYAQICSSLEYPIRLKGDSFFDSIDNVLNSIDLDTITQKNEKLTKENVLKTLLSKPVFMWLKA